MIPTTKQRLSRTHGKNGLAPLPAVDDDLDPLDEALDLALQVAQHGRSSRVLLVDGDRCDTILIGAAATTPEDSLC